MATPKRPSELVEEDSEHEQGLRKRDGDRRQGRKDVEIGGNPVMLADQSYYSSSPLGNEAATKNLGGSLLTHTITGKGYQKGVRYFFGGALLLRPSGAVRPSLGP